MTRKTKKRIEIINSFLNGINFKKTKKEQGIVLKNGFLVIIKLSN